MTILSKPSLGLKRKALTLATLALAASAAMAEPVSLRSTDGTVNLEGDLISYNGEYYLLQTVLGDLRISAERMSCFGPGCPQLETVEADLVIGGSDTIAEGLMPLLLEGFATSTGASSNVEAARSDTSFATTLVGQDGFGDKIGTFSVQSGASGDAFSGLLDNSIQIGVASRRITPDEARALTAAGAGNMIDPSQEHIVAVDSLTLIVNNANQISELSLANLAAIYSGEITNWSQVGGPNLAILPVTLRDDAATAVFQAGVFGDGAAPNLFSSHLAEDNVAAASYVGQNPGAIAYVGFAFKRGQKPLTLISECGIGTTPDAFSVKTEEYSLFRRLYMYNRADVDSPLVDDLIAFATSDASSAVILQSGFIDLSVERVAQGSDSPRARRIAGSGADSYENRFVDDMIGLMGSNDRLSATFRFRTGSSTLDLRGQEDLVRLASYLEGLPAGSKVTFVGFADSVGAFEPNVGLSRARAAAVNRELAALAGSSLDQLTFDVVGFGEVAPSACNSNEAGRTINRRVETWVELP